MKNLRYLFVAVALLLASLTQAEITADKTLLEPTEVVLQTADRVIERLRVSRPLSDEQATTLVEELILPHLDFETFARLTLGKYWRQASPEQRTAFTQEFHRLLLRSYATSLNAYSGERIEHIGQRNEPGDRLLMQTQMIRAHGAPVRIDYRLHKRESEWKIYDVVIEGISLIMTYRTSFSEEIRRTGLDALILKLSDRRIKAQCLAGTKKDC